MSESMLLTTVAIDGSPSVTAEAIEASPFYQHRIAFQGFSLNLSDDAAMALYMALGSTLGVEGGE